MARDCSHFEIVGYDEMLVAELLSQQLGHDVVIQRSRLEQAARDLFPDVDIGKATVTDHHATHAIVTSLKELDVRREILRDQIVVRESNHRHLFMRIDFARPDARKMFETAEQASALETAHVNSGVAEHFTRRASERS